MDISTNIYGTNFNLRTRGIIIKNNKLLCINDKGTYFYLPGGRIHINENAKVALKREIKEELGFNCTINECIYVHEAFYNGNHEVCFYFLIDIKDLPDKNFKNKEEEKINKFYWLDLNTIEKYTVYPKKIIELIKNSSFNKCIIFD